MRCGLLTNSVGEIAIIHDRPLASDIQWIEYDQSDNSFALVHEDGTIQPLGLKLDQKMQNNLSNGTEVTLLYIEDKLIKESQSVVFLVRS